jgi:TetR/AcrR family transcriptional regulator, fatty acid metabolism regulator protein
MQLTHRQEEILFAAIDIIAERGIQGLTTKNLAKKLNFTEPAIYRHFQGKQEILITILNYFSSRFNELLDKVEHDNPLQAIEMKMKMMIEHLSDKPAVVAVIFSEEIFQNNPELIRMTHELFDKNLSRIGILLAKGQKMGIVRTDVAVEKLMYIILGSIRMLMTHWRFSNYSFDLKKEGFEIIENLTTIIKQ